MPEAPRPPLALVLLPTEPGPEETEWYEEKGEVTEVPAVERVCAFGGGLKGKEADAGLLKGLLKGLPLLRGGEEAVF